LFRLLPEDQLREAEVLGKAMRFGAMFAGGDPALAGSLRHQPRKGILRLTLTLRGQALFGEVAEARFRALAAALKAEAVIERSDRLAGPRKAQAGR
jgi:exopolyphosphatase/guanosine-5'-triphosphate,3'-diphosphate pyrophosphatase